MKKYFLNALRRAGYQISRIPAPGDLEVYRELYPQESIDNKRFFNIGAGEFCHPCWTCIDRSLDWFNKNSHGTGAAISYDLFSNEPLPAASGTIELVYISHTLGHVDDTAVRNVFRESFRILKPGGRIRVVTEDMDLFYQAWKDQDHHFFYWKNWKSVNSDFRKYGLKMPLREATITQVFLEEFAASASEIADEGGTERISDEKFKELFSTLPMDQAFDYCVARCPKALQEKYPFRHMNWFNEAKLKRLLTDAGFGEVYRSSYLQSRAAVLRNASYFDRTVPGLSLFAEARKL